VNEPFDATGRSLPPLFWSTSPEPTRPVTEPPTVKVPLVQLTTMPVTLALGTTPLPLETEHDCAGFAGWASTLTA
jgi:hypothetical protein